MTYMKDKCKDSHKKTSIKVTNSSKLNICKRDIGMPVIGNDDSIVGFLVHDRHLYRAKARWLDSETLNIIEGSSEIKFL